jgi:outer membrane protein assembly factor BamD
MREDSLAYYTAYAYFKSDDFTTSSEMFDDFRRKYTRSPFLEDVEGMYALSFYYLSPEPTRDQTTTEQALTAIHEFIGRYPNSTRRAAFEQMIRELTQKQYDKVFINAKTYYTIGRYKSAVPALKNALKKYPDSPHREELMYLIVKSSYELAKNSIESLQRDRYLNMLDSYYSFIAEFPESKHVRELSRMQEDAKRFIAKFGSDEQKAEVEKQEAQELI